MREMKATSTQPKEPGCGITPGRVAETSSGRLPRLISSMDVLRGVDSMDAHVSGRSMDASKQPPEGLRLVSLDLCPACRRRRPFRGARESARRLRRGVDRSAL